MNDTDQQPPFDESTADFDPQAQDLNDALKDLRATMEVFAMFFGPDPRDYEYS